MPASTQTLQAIQDYHTKINVHDLSQPNDYTCQSTCIAMAVDDSNITDIRQRLNIVGEQRGTGAGDPDVMAEVIRDLLKDHRLEDNKHLVSYELHKDACLNEVKQWLEAGDFLITHGWFTHSGHVICLSGLEVDTENNSYKLEVKDPWSEFDAPKWTYDLGSKFYGGYYSSRCIYAACVAGASFSDAAATYNRGELDSGRTGMWVHRFTPISDPNPQPSPSISSGSSTTLEQAVEPLLNLISQGEGGPDAMNQGTMNGRIVGSTNDSKTVIGVELTSLTIAELMKRQAYEMDTKNPQQNNYGVFAAGKYQFIPDTLKEIVAASGLPTTQLFNVKNQDFLCLELIRSRANAAYQYMQGKSDDLNGAINALACQWASIPTTSGGTAYAGTGNNACHNVNSVGQVLQEVRARVLGQA